MVMNSMIEHPDSQAGNRSWMWYGALTFVTVESVHVVAGTVLNDWEGWGLFWENFAFIVVSGLIITVFVYGVLVRRGLEPQARNRTGAMSLATGLLSVLSIAAFFLWAHFLVAPAAVLLGRVGLVRSNDRRGKVMALSGTLIGIAVLAFGVVLLVYAFLNEGDYPIFG